MDESCRVALGEGIWRATVAVLAAGAILFVVSDLHVGLLAATGIALLYTLMNIVCALQLKGAEASEPEWVSALFLRERQAEVNDRDPFSPPGLVMLRFAKGGAAAAIALSAAAFIV
ncbi:MAG: hypothetical protein HXY30_16115 [Pseudorhodoplanes sp.]|nr:hypothetical protein [Pseudorhodoplanes sp.]